MEDEAWRSLMVRFETHLAAEKGLAALTVRNYKTDLQPLFDFMRLRDVGGLDALDRYALRAYLAWLVELGYVRASVVRKLSTLRTFLRWLIREKELDKDPLPRRGVMKKEARLPRFLSEDDAAKLMDAPDASRDLGARDRALLELLYAGGLRVSEAGGPRPARRRAGDDGGPRARQGRQAACRADGCGGPRRGRALRP